MNNRIFLRKTITEGTLRLLALQLTYPLQKLALLPYPKIEVLRALANSDPVKCLQEISDVISNFRIETIR